MERKFEMEKTHLWRIKDVFVSHEEEAQYIKSFRDTVRSISKYESKKFDQSDRRKEYLFCKQLFLMALFFKENIEVIQDLVRYMRGREIKVDENETL